MSRAPSLETCFKKKGRNIRPTYVDWLILGVLSVVWGCSFILIKRSLVAFDPIQVASLRIVIAALAFLPFVPAHLRKVKRSD